MELKKMKTIARYTLTVFVLMAVATGCFEQKSPLKVDLKKLAALVVTTDFQSGSYAVVDVEGREVFKNVDLIHQDAVCRYSSSTRLPYIVARLGADAIDVVRPDSGWGISSEYSVGAGTNPRDIAVVSENRAYVARFDEPDLLIVHPGTGDQLGKVDLSQYADDDGAPETSWLYYLNGKVYALLQRLDSSNGYKPTEFSLLLILDGETGLVEDSIELTVSNPFGKFRYNETLEKLVIVESGVFSTSDESAPFDGGIEYFDPISKSLSGLVITEEELGGDIVDAVIVSETKGYAVIGLPGGSVDKTNVVAFDPSTGEKRSTLISADSWVFNFMEVSPDGTELWVADRTMNSPGIRIFDTATDEELTEKPLDVGLPPFMICFVEFFENMDPDSDTEEEDGGDDSGLIVPGLLDYADQVVDAPCEKLDSEFGDPTLAVNGVRGAGDNAAGLDIYSLRYCGDPTEKYLTIRWSNRVVTNGSGIDFSVFENSYFIGGQEGLFMEHLIVYLSRDGITWVPFPHDYINSPETAYSQDPADWPGFAGRMPVKLHMEDNPVDPFDEDLAGGDHFDLDDLPDDGEAGLIKSEGFTYLKLVQATSETNPDTGEAYLKDPSSFDEAADIDGAYARYLVEQ